jgi:transposase-like protein
MAKKTRKPVQQMTIQQFDAAFPDEDSCKEYLVRRRWPMGVRCPRCGNDKVYELKAREFHWQCQQCDTDGYRFSVYVGTIYENTNMPLRTWFSVIYMMVTAKKGVSALQVHRTIGTGSYRTAWSMCHRIRAGLLEPKTKLGGVVEVDETYVGGDDKNRHVGKRYGVTGRGAGGKTPVVGAVKRKGNVVARVVENTRTETIEKFIRETVSTRVSVICTDAYSSYRRLDRKYRHASVDHSKGEHVVGAIHTNTIEGFWSLVKRGIVGTFHKVSPKYLPLYVREFEFRYNNRNNADIFGAAFEG